MSRRYRLDDIEEIRPVDAYEKFALVEGRGLCEIDRCYEYDVDGSPFYTVERSVSVARLRKVIDAYSRHRFGGHLGRVKVWECWGRGGNTYEVERVGDKLYIGCKTFSAEAVKQMRKWLRRKR